MNRVWIVIVRWMERPQVQRNIAWGFIALAAASFGFVTRAGDLDGFVQVGKLVIEQKWIYFDPYVNTWPPFFSVVFAPLSIVAELSVHAFRAFWILLNLISLFIALHLVSRFTYDQPLSLSVERRIYLGTPEIIVPLILSARYIITNLQYLQINIPLFAVTLGGLYMLKKQRAVIGGLLIGFTAALKVMPAAFIPYFLLRKQWRNAFYTSLWTALLSLSPILVFGWTRFWEYVAAWRNVLPFTWSVGRMNQSVFAMWDRWIGHGIAPFSTNGIQGLQHSGEPMARVAWMMTLGIVIIIGLLACRKPPSPQYENANANWAELAEWSAVFIITAIFGPVTWKAFLIVLLLPYALIFAVWRAHPQQSVKTLCTFLMSISLVIGSFTGPGLIGSKSAGVLDMASVMTWNTLMVLFGLFWIRKSLSGLRSAPSR